MISIRMSNLQKIGVIAALATTLAISDSAFALNLIQNTVSNNAAGGSRFGQSFVIDPLGTGSLLSLDSWTFAFNGLGNATTAQTFTLSIYNGVGNGGIKVGDSTGTATIATFAGFDSVVWSFSGLPQLIDKSTYTTVLNGNAQLRYSEFDPYPNGFLTSGTGIPSTNFDTAFRANFSAATAVPFEFEPTGGLAILGGGWLLRRHLKKKKATKV
jgi:hypothetical protein